MKKRSVIALYCSLLVVACCGTSIAATSVRESQIAFVHVYVAAVQSKDPARVMALLHPSMRSCVNGRTRSFFDYIVAQQMQGFPTGNYTKLTITPVAPKSSPIIWGFVPAKGFPYPVKPSYNIQIDYSPASNDLFSDILETAPSGDSWYWVTACPNKEGLEFMRFSTERGARQKAHVAKLAAALHDPLLTQIKTLLKKSDRIGAISLYRKASGADITTAVMVIDVIQGPKP